MQLPIRRYIHMSSNNGDHSRPTASNVVFLEAGDTLIEGSSDSPPDPSQQITRELRPQVSFRGDKRSPGEDNSGVGASGLASYSPMELSDKARKYLYSATHQSETALGACKRLQEVYSSMKDDISDHDYKAKENTALGRMQYTSQTSNATIQQLIEFANAVFSSPEAHQWGLEASDVVAARELAESDARDESSARYECFRLVNKVREQLSHSDQGTLDLIMRRLQNCNYELNGPQGDAIHEASWKEHEDDE